MRALKAIVGGVLGMLALAACGTATFDNTFIVTIDDLSGRLGVPPTDVSIFDQRMGDTADWAKQHMGTTSPGSPYQTTVFATETRMIGDSGPPKNVSVGLYLPSYYKDGYFWVEFDPALAAEQDVIATFVPYADFYPEGKKVVPLPLHVVGAAGEDGWTLGVTVKVPPKA